MVMEKSEMKMDYLVDNVKNAQIIVLLVLLIQKKAYHVLLDLDQLLMKLVKILVNVKNALIIAIHVQIILKFVSNVIQDMDIY